MSVETLRYATDQKAAKEHVCNFCGEKIRVGEVYSISTHKGDGGIYDWKTHKYCGQLATDLKMYDDCDEGVTQDDFMESVSGYYYDTMLKMFSQEDIKKYSEAIQELRWVRFRQKLMYVLAHVKKQKIKNPQ